MNWFVAAGRETARLATERRRASHQLWGRFSDQTGELRFDRHVEVAFGELQIAILQDL
jgi:hypothetical protein